jgi:serine protease Do
VVSRNGKNKTFTVTLDSLSSDDEGNLLGAGGEAIQSNKLGIAVERINENRRRALGDPEGGVLISSVENDAAFRSGLRNGDVILTINNESVEDTASFNEIVESLPEGKAVALRVMREGITRYIAFTPSVEE